MDPNANPGTPDPVTRPTPPPAGNQPDRAAEVSALKAWLRENAVSLLITAIVVALVLVYLDPVGTAMVVFGLGLVIFIHELGHFLAAKWCDVHVKTFSIGFGPAVPFMSYKWGETTYMVGIIPLGGYVSMVGEGDNAGDEDAEEDPRSFRHKSVGQRMLIISAGVIMNILLGMACFVAAYLHGVQERPAGIGWVESGGAAWRAGIRADDEVTRVNTRDDPFFDDIRSRVIVTKKGESVDLTVRRPDGRTESIRVEPLKEETSRFPQLGIAPPERPTLLPSKRTGFRPVVPGTPAAAADPGFEPGDRIVGMTNPDDPARGVTPLKPHPRDPARGGDINDYYERMRRLAGEPVTFRVLRRNLPHDGPTVDISVRPAYRSDLGMRMRMGEVAALRAGGPAANAGVKARIESPPAAGDRIVTVKLPEKDGGQTWFAAGDVRPDEPNVAVKKLDPVLLPLELKRWADRNPGGSREVRLVVMRTVGHNDGSLVPVTLTYDDTFGDDREKTILPNSPIALGGLGLAYWADAVVDEVDPAGPAARAKTAPGEPPSGFGHRVARFLGLEDRAGPPGGDPMPLRPNDTITAVRFKAVDEAGKLKVGDWVEVKGHQWASAESAFQASPVREIDLKVKRGDEETVVTLTGREDRGWPDDDRGLVLQTDYVTVRAADIGEAVSLGAGRTARFMRDIYGNLYAMLFARVSAKTMSGPLTIANVSYRLAGEDFWQFLLFIGMISVNLAVVNFLPIPVLDGGHMVFLLLEWILGRPVPERVFAFAMYTGLFLILSLMVFVLFLDVRRVFFGWF